MCVCQLQPHKGAKFGLVSAFLQLPEQSGLSYLSCTSKSSSRSWGCARLFQLSLFGGKYQSRGLKAHGGSALSLSGTAWLLHLAPPCIGALLWPLAIQWWHGMCTTGVGLSTGACVQLGTCGISGLMTWILLLRLPSWPPSLMCMLLTGRALWLLGRGSLSIPGLAQVAICLACARTMLDLLGLPILAAKLSSGWLCRTSVCRLYSDLDWAVTASPKMWVAGLQCLGHREYALSAMLVCQAISNTLCLSVRAYNIFGTMLQFM